MRTLDEVIKSLENNCTKCGNCAYAEETYCGEKIRQDALHYLLTWKLIVESERKAHKADVPANLPLTWDELRQMLGKPVWMEWNECKGWRLVNCFDSVTTGKKEVALTDRFGVDFVFDEETIVKCKVKVYRKERE